MNDLVFQTNFSHININSVRNCRHSKRISLSKKYISLNYYFAHAVNIINGILKNYLILHFIHQILNNHYFLSYFLFHSLIITITIIVIIIINPIFIYSNHSYN